MALHEVKAGRYILKWLESQCPRIDEILLPVLLLYK
jgi:hypothetical protein